MYVCAGKGGKDTCFGDSGGPLLIRDISLHSESIQFRSVKSHGQDADGLMKMKGNGQWNMIGLVSFGASTKATTGSPLPVCGRSDDVGFYFRVAAAKSWISSIIQQ